MSAYKTLLVEDDPALSHLAKITLERRDLDVAHAADGFEALDYLDNTEPDLILLDLNIPGIDGWTVLEAAKNRYGDGSFKVIITSARRDSISRAKGDIATVDHYLVKPFTPSELLKAIDIVMGIGAEPAEPPAEADDAIDATEAVETPENDS